MLGSRGLTKDGGTKFKLGVDNALLCVAGDLRGSAFPFCLRIDMMGMDGFDESSSVLLSPLLSISVLSSMMFSFGAGSEGESFICILLRAINKSSLERAKGRLAWSFIWIHINQPLDHRHFD